MKVNYGIKEFNLKDHEQITKLFERIYLAKLIILDYTYIKAFANTALSIANLLTFANILTNSYLFVN